MCNCGQKRLSFKTKEDPAYRNTVRVKLAGGKPCVVYGGITGRTYIFRNTGDINHVDRRDLPQFENNRLFARL